MECLGPSKAQWPRSKNNHIAHKIERVNKDIRSNWRRDWPAPPATARTTHRSATTVLATSISVALSGPRGKMRSTLSHLNRQLPTRRFTSINRYTSCLGSAWTLIGSDSRHRHEPKFRSGSPKPARQSTQLSRQAALGFYRPEMDSGCRVVTNWMASVFCWFPLMFAP